MMNYFKRLWEHHHQPPSVKLTSEGVKNAVVREIEFLERRINAIEQAQQEHERYHATA